MLAKGSTVIKSVKLPLYVVKVFLYYNLLYPAVQNISHNANFYFIA